LSKYLVEQDIFNDSLRLTDPNLDSLKSYQEAANLLVRFRFLAPTATEDSVALLSALMKFQKAHGIEVDGRIGPNTREALTINTYDRYRQIVVNLERLRWEKTLPDSFVLVNIPSYQLSFVEVGCVVRVHRVVVGLPYLRTPLLTSQIEYMIANPTWYVPNSISTHEMLGTIKNDPDYLRRNNYMVFDAQNSQVAVSEVDWESLSPSNFNYKIAQGPGRGNALGSIVFMFPSQYGVYLHDTSAKSYFERTIRAFSHGCVRLQDPVDFAQYLLEREQHPVDQDSLGQIIEKHISRNIAFRHPIPILIRYQSCLADAFGNLTFYKDIYREDAALIKIYFAKLNEMAR